MTLPEVRCRIVAAVEASTTAIRDCRADASLTQPLLGFEMSPGGQALLGLKFAARCLPDKLHLEVFDGLLKGRRFAAESLEVRLADRLDTLVNGIRGGAIDVLEAVPCFAYGALNLLAAGVRASLHA